MDFLVNNLERILSIVGLFITLYTFYNVRRSKFVLINIERKTIIDNNNNLDIKYDCHRIATKLIYQNFVICYIGATDIDKDDIKIPLIISGKSENLRFIEYNVIKTTKNFNPRIILRDKKIEIQNDSFHNGDLIDIGILTESNNSDLQINHRFLNVNSSIREFDGNKKNIFTLVPIILLMIITGFIMSSIIRDYNLSQNTKYYDTEYIYKGFSINKNKFRNDDIVDSLYLENLKNSDSQYKNIIEVYEDPTKIINSNIPFKNIKESIDSIYINKPSVLATKLYLKLDSLKKIEFKKEYNINNELIVMFRNPLEHSIKSMILNFLFIIFLLFVEVILLLGAIKYCINIYYVNTVRKHIK